MKTTNWLARVERATWVAAVEAAALTLILFAGPSTSVRLFVGVPMLAHLAWTAFARPSLEQPSHGSQGATGVRRNDYLRTSVVGFLAEVRRVEAYAQRARSAGLSGETVELSLERGERRIMAAASVVAKVTGR